MERQDWARAVREINELAGSYRRTLMCTMIPMQLSFAAAVPLGVVVHPAFFALIGVFVLFLFHIITVMLNHPKKKQDLQFQLNNKVFHGALLELDDRGQGPTVRVDRSILASHHAANKKAVPNPVSWRLFSNRQSIGG